jgi:hypothetical protein
MVRGQEVFRGLRSEALYRPDARSEAEPLRGRAELSCDDGWHGVLRRRGGEVAQLAARRVANGRGRPIVDVMF